VQGSSHFGKCTSGDPFATEEFISTATSTGDLSQHCSSICNYEGVASQTNFEIYIDIPIYIKEYLTKLNFDLLYKAKQLVKNKYIKWYATACPDLAQKESDIC
jgi:hypothetical protein